MGATSSDAPDQPRVLPEVPVTPANRVVAPASNSPVIVADPDDADFVVLANRLDAPDFGCTLQLSGDGGRGWVSVRPMPALPPGADKCYAPEVAFDGEGSLHYLFVGLAGNGNRPMGAFLTTSRDRGRTFTTPRQILGPNNFGVRMALDRTQGRAGRMHVVWLHAGSGPALGGFAAAPNPILAAHSDDGGTTFSEPIEISSPSRARVVAPSLALGPAHAVHVGYYDLEADARDYQGLEGPVWEGSWSLVSRTSLDGGERFGPETVVADGIVPHERVMLVFTMPPPALVGLKGGGLCAAWTDARHGDPDVLLRCSRRARGPWAEVRRVNDDGVGSGAHQYQPRLAQAPGGRLDVVFYDRRLDPGNRLNHVFATFSHDGAETFAPNIRLTQDDSNTRLGPQYAVESANGLVEFGSRIGLLSTRSEALAAWTDTRNGDRGQTSQDIFATTLQFDANGWDGRPVLAVAGTVAAAILSAGGLFLLRRARRQRGLRHGPKRLPAALLLAVTALAGCSPGGASDEGWPPRPTRVSVIMEEFRFVYDQRIPSGRVVFEVRNAGTLEHELQFIPLPEDFPPIDAQLRGSQRRTINALAGVPHRRPGQRGTFAVDLHPGQRYALICFLTEGGGSHARKGMNSEFRALPTPTSDSPR